MDDRFFDNPKIAALSDRAKVAYLEGGTYCARELTDGFIPSVKAKAIAGNPKALKELTPHLWEPCPGGYQVHDYLVYNPTRVKALADKAAASEAHSKAGSKGAAKRWQTDSKDDGKNMAPLPHIPEGDLDNPLPDLPYPDPPHPEPLLPRREVVLGFERCFARLLSPTELELVKALQEEHPDERIEYALKESAALNKRSVRYVQRTCERLANEGDSTSNGHALPRPSLRYGVKP